LLDKFESEKDTAMTSTHTVNVKTSAAHAWKIIGEEFVPVDKWMEAISRADTIPGPALPGAPAKGRTSHLRGKFAHVYQSEVITAYSDAARTISTEVTIHNLPRMVPMKGYNATIVVKETGTESCSITYTGEARTKWFGRPMKNALTKSMDAGYLRGLEELAHYIETGEQHPRKVETVQADAAMTAA
jgi:hypothetical protein